MKALTFKQTFTVRRLTYKQVLLNGYTVMLSKRYQKILKRKLFLQPDWAVTAEYPAYQIYRFGWKNCMLPQMNK